MKLVFAGLEHPVELAAGEVAVLQVENSALFARFANSLQSELEPGLRAIFPMGWGERN